MALLKGQEQMESLVYRLMERARIRRSILDRKSVAEGKPDRIADLLEEAAQEIVYLQEKCSRLASERAYYAEDVGRREQGIFG